MRLSARAIAMLAVCFGILVSRIPLVGAEELNIDRFLPDTHAACAGDLEKRHQGDPPWDITTNSRGPTPEEPTVYLHCVHNNDPRNVVDVNWVIPNVKQPILPKSSAISPRYSDRPPIGREEGCLIFGNLMNKALRAQFWARPEDHENLDGEHGKDCLSLVQTGAHNEKRKVEAPADIVAPFRIFLRSDPNAQASPLVAFEGITGLRMKGASAYLSYVTYQIRDEKNLPPEVQFSFTVTPRWAGPTELLAKDFFSQNKRPIQLISRKEPTTFAFVVEGGGTWNLHELEYDVSDSNGKVMGTLYSPVLIPLR